MSASKLYDALLTTAPLLPPAVLRAAYTDAAATSDSDRLAVLAARPDLPTDLLEQVAATSDPKVRAAYLGRPTRPDQATNRRPERRAAVLAKAMGRYTTVDGAMFADAITAYMAKPTSALLKVLVERPAGWYTSEQAYALLMGVDRDTKYVPSPAGLVNLIARLDRATLGKLVRNASTAVVLNPAVDFDVPADALLAMLQKLSPDVSSVWHGALAPLSEERVQLRDDLVTWARDHKPDLVPLASRAGTSYPRKPPRASDTRPAEPPTIATSLHDADEVVLAAAATSDDPAVLRQVVQVVCEHITNRPDPRRVPAQVLNTVPVLLRNRALPRQALIDLADGLGTLRPGLYELDKIAKLDALSLWQCPQLTATWTYLFPADVLRLHGWAPFGGQRTATTWLAAWFEQAHTLFSLRPIVDAALHAGLDDEQLLTIPYPAFAEAVLDAPGGGWCLVADRVARILNERLTAQQWVTFGQLADTFTGSLGDLLDVATSLTT